MVMKMMKQSIIEEFDTTLKVEENFDIIKRQYQNADVTMTIYFIDGFCKDDIVEKMMEFLLQHAKYKTTCESFCKAYIPYGEATIESSIKQMETAILSGSLVLLVDGYQEGIVIDTRTYPTRSMEEPEDDKVLRGSHDGFVETLILNTALIRRRVRSPQVRMCYQSIGTVSQTDVVICYMVDKADETLVRDIKGKLASIDVEALTMAQESLVEAMVDHAWINPFPKVRFTERPDVAVSNLLEGKVLVLVDHSCSVMMLPTTFFEFVQEAQDYYFPPITGSYLRLVRMLVFLLTLFGTPLWYYFNLHPSYVPDILSFIVITKPQNLPILVQLLLLEVGIDALKLASLNTPSSLHSSFSIIGALILGDYTVKAGWFAPEVILYMAFVSLANFTQTSYELGYAVKFMRVLLLLWIGCFPTIGLWIGLLFIVSIIVTNKTITHMPYFYPLYPFDLHACKRLFTREKLKEKE